MKKILTIIALLLKVTAQAQHIPIPVGSTTILTGERWSTVHTYSLVTLSNANLMAASAGNGGLALGSIGHSGTGLYYCEYTFTIGSPSFQMAGIANISVNNTGYPGFDPNGWSYAYSGNKFTNSTQSAYGSSWTTLTVAVALDLTNGAVYFGLISSGIITWQNSGVPTSGASKTGAAFTGLTGTLYPAVGWIGGGIGTCTANFGGSAYAGTVPAGYGNW